jgi:hydroxymethylpyrimidine/phosphomethylpyrimidine kinase
MQAAAASLANYGSRSVLIKGGHGGQNKSTDVLYLAAEKRMVVLAAARIASHNNHGTGCTLSSAIAAGMARGDDIETAVRKAKSYIENAIRTGARYTLGHGHGPVHHFFNYWQ